MKTHKLLAPLLAACLLQAISVDAQLFQANVRGTCRYVDGSDRVARKAFNNATILGDYAAAQGLDPRSLRLAYDLDGDRLAIVDSNGQILESYLEFGLPTAVGTSDDSQRERQVFLFPPGVSDAVGSASISERLSRNGEGVIIRTRTRGSMQFTQTNTSDGTTEVCSGTFTAGKKINVVEPEPEPAP